MSIVSPSADELDGWVRRKLPQLNDELDQITDSAKDARTGVLIDELARFSDSLRADSHVLLQAGEGEVLEVLGNLGFMLASCARHQVSMEHPKLGPTIDLLHDLGAAIGHPPRDSLYTYVISNTRDQWGRYRAFTPHTDEQAFIDLTRQALEYSEKALRALQEFQSTGYRRAALLKEAIRHTMSYQGCFHAFEMKDRGGKRAMEPDFFYRLFRDYFPTVELKGVSWGPPTAANAAPVIITDFVLGVATGSYGTHIAKRLRYFTLHDQFRIRQAMRTPSILDELVEPETSDAVTVAEQIDSRGKREVAACFLELVQRVGGASSTHWGLLRKYLMKPAQEEQRLLQGRGTATGSGDGAPARLHAPIPDRASADDTAAHIHGHVVNPSQGASGMQFPEVWSIREMRVNNPRVLLLQKATDLVGAR